MHFAAIQNLFAANDWNVILTLASDHTGVATHAGVEIDGHRPPVVAPLEVRLLPHRQLVHDVRAVLREVRRTYDGPLALAVDYMVWNVTKEDIRVRMAAKDESA